MCLVIPLLAGEGAVCKPSFASGISKKCIRIMICYYGDVTGCVNFTDMMFAMILNVFSV